MSTALCVFATAEASPQPSGVPAGVLNGNNVWMMYFPNAMQVRGSVVPGRYPCVGPFPPPPAAPPAGTDFPVLYVTQPGIYTINAEISWASATPPAVSPIPSDTTSLPLIVTVCANAVDVTDRAGPCPPSTAPYQWSNDVQSDFVSAVTTTPYALSQGKTKKGAVIARSVVQGVSGKVVFTPTSPNSRLAIVIHAQADVGLGAPIPQLVAFSLEVEPLGTAPFHSLVAQAAPAAPAAPPGFTPPSPAVSDYAVYSVTLPQAYYPPHLPHHHHRHPQQHAHYPSLHPYYRNFTPSYI